MLVSPSVEFKRHSVFRNDMIKIDGPSRARERKLRQAPAL